MSPLKHGLDRRTFLKASGLAAGVALLEGCVKDEVAYIEQPVTAHLLPGETVWTSSVCQQCPAGCGIRVRTVDGDAKKIEGNPNHPINRGGLCALGQSSLQELYNPDRIKSPLKRNGSRGTTDFEEISWDQALEEIASSLSNAIGEDPGSVLFANASNSMLVELLMERLARGIGAPPPAACLPLDEEVERRAARLALGIDRPPIFDIKQADFVLSLGPAFLERWRSPVRYARDLAEMRRSRPGRRGRFVQVEPRLSMTAAAADSQLLVRPGTEGILARALAGAILDDGRTAPSDAQRYRRLFSEKPPSIDEAAIACDIPAARIRRLAEALAGSERPLVLAGGTSGGYVNGLHIVTSALALNVLLGNLGRPGGLHAPRTRPLTRETSPAESRPTFAEQASNWSRSGAPRWILIAEGDPLHTLPRSWKLREAVSSTTIVKLGSFFDDTALHADYILPTHTELERFDLVLPRPAHGGTVIGLSQPVVQPVVDSRHPGDLLLAVARALGGSASEALPWPSAVNLMETRIEESLDELPGGQETDFWSFYTPALEAGGVWDDSATPSAPPGPNGAFPESPTIAAEAEDARFPFVVVPFESIRTADGRGANRPWLQELPDPISSVMWGAWVEISTADATRLGIRTGDRVQLESSDGTIEAPASVLPGVRPGTVAVPGGQGHDEFGRWAKGRGVDPLDLVGSGRVQGTHLPAWAGTRVRVVRIDAGQVALFGRGLRQIEDLPHRR